jgi:prevent-host-death family protein
LRVDAAGILRQVAGSCTPVYVTQRGRLTAVLVSRPLYERLRRGHEILCRMVRGELDFDFEPGMTLDDVLRRGEQALEDERVAQARALAAEARRLEDEERQPPDRRPPCTFEEFMAEFGIEPRWPGAPGSES